MLLLLRSSRTRFGKLSNTSESTDCISFPLRYKSVNCSRGLGKESALILEMLFPVTNRILVLLGIEFGIESKSCFWHFTVCEEHTHRSGQLRQGSETASTTSRWTIADPSPLRRISPHAELNRRISVTVRKDSLDENSILAVPPCSSARHTPKFFQLFRFLKTRLYLLSYHSNSTELLFIPSSLRTSAQLHEKILWTKPANLCLLAVLFFCFPKGARFYANTRNVLWLRQNIYVRSKTGESAKKPSWWFPQRGHETQSHFQSVRRRLNIGAGRRFPVEGGTVPSCGRRGWVENDSNFSLGLNSLFLLGKKSYPH